MGNSAMNGTSRDNEESQAGRDVDTCPVCRHGYESFTDKMFLPCAHYFHKNCIDQWLAAHHSCPICSTFYNGANLPTEQADAAFDLGPTLAAMQQAANNMQEVGRTMQRSVNQMKQNLQDLQQQFQRFQQSFFPK